MSAQRAWIREEDPFARAQDEFLQRVEYLRKGEGRDLSHEKLEEALSERGRELQRLLFQAQVDSRGSGPADDPVCGADGMLRNVERLHERGLLTVFGEVRIRRLGYGTTGGGQRSPPGRRTQSACRSLFAGRASRGGRTGSPGFLRCDR